MSLSGNVKLWYHWSLQISSRKGIIPPPPKKLTDCHTHQKSFGKIQSSQDLSESPVIQITESTWTIRLSESLAIRRDLGIILRLYILPYLSDSLVEGSFS